MRIITGPLSPVRKSISQGILAIAASFALLRPLRYCQGAFPRLRSQYPAKAMQIVRAGAHTAGVGSTEGNHRLSGKIIVFQKSVDDSRSLPMPDGIAQQHDIIPAHIFYSAVS